MKILVSSCLLGIPCRYDGKPAPTALTKEQIEKIGENHTLIPVCPEMLGGLGAPRDPAERRGEKVLSKSGKDITEEFESGAKATLRIAKELGCDIALLKEKSPSCGCGSIYDGSFQGKLKEGNGVTSELLLRNGIKVIGESKVNEIE